MIVYKMVRVRADGTFGPMFVGTDEVFPVGIIISADTHHRRQADKVFSKLGWLKYRPGLHLTVVPYAPHIGIKDTDGIIKWMHDDTVWVECEVPDELNYTAEAHANGICKGRYDPKKACLDRIPTNGWYWYTTNPNAQVDWLIAHHMIIHRVLTDGEVQNICSRFGIKAIVHKSDKYLARIAKVA